jgi:tRNA(Ile)-lysidine synthase
MHHDSPREVLRAARTAASAADAPLLLAVSGGLDSMVLLYAMAATARSRIAAVATFDHGTGPAASATAAHVARTAALLRLPVVMGRDDAHEPAGGGREAEWRRARYQFLESAATALEARIVTAHTADDQIETVLMRVMRGSGARGLAGLFAPGPVLRPFVGLRRTTLAAYSREARIRFRADPTNDGREFLRNRVRHDLLPALRTVRPAIDEELLTVATRAAAWRAEVENHIDRAVHPRREGSNALSVASQELSGYDRDSLSVLWGALGGRVGLALDRRGTERLAAFTIGDPRSGTVPLSGGWYMDARGGVYILGKRPRATSGPVGLPARGELLWGGFRFRVDGDAGAGGSAIAGEGSWRATLPLAANACVRAWSAGDRLGPSAGRPPRRVKRYLSDAGLRGLERAGWPVVVVGEQEGNDVAWIPGVRRADAATERSGGPVRHYICERIDC